MQTRDRTACHSLDEVEPLGYSNTQSKKSILLGFGDAPPRSVVSEPSDRGKENPRHLSQKLIIALQKSILCLTRCGVLCTVPCNRSPSRVNWLTRPSPFTGKKSKQWGALKLRCGFRLFG